jgi:hypothetical protein
VHYRRLLLHLLSRLLPPESSGLGVGLGTGRCKRTHTRGDGSGGGDAAVLRRRHRWLREQQRDLPYFAPLTQDPAATAAFNARTSDQVWQSQLDEELQVCNALFFCLMFFCCFFSFNARTSDQVWQSQLDEELQVRFFSRLCLVLFFSFSSPFSHIFSFLFLSLSFLIL